MRRLLVPALAAAVAAVAVPTGSAQASAALNPSATSIDFGSGRILYPQPDQTITFTALRDVTPSVQEITQDGIDPETKTPDFEVIDDKCSTVTLHTGDTCTVQVRFTPYVAGKVTGHLTLTDDSGTTSVTLTGTGTEDPTGTYRRSPAKRLLDTRYMGARKPLGARATRSIQITGANGVPASGVSAVVVNLTATKPTASSFLTVYPSGKARPNASALTFPKGFTGANLVTVPVGGDGRITVFNNAGATHVVVDLVGYYSDGTASVKGADYLPWEPFRVLDTRYSGDRRPLKDGGWLRLDGGDGQTRTTTVAYAVNITAVNPTSGGYFTAMNTKPNGVPSTSTLTYTAGQTVANMAVVPVNSVGSFWVRNTQARSGHVHMLIDVVGEYFADPEDPFGFRYRAIDPKRVLDTRNRIGLAGAFGSGSARTLQLPETIAADDTGAVVGNLTAVAPSANTYLTVWGAGDPRPDASNLNLNKGQTRANAVAPPVGSLDPETDDWGQVSIYNRVGTTHAILDITGAFDAYGPKEEPAAARKKNVDRHKRARKSAPLHAVRGRE